MIWKAKHPYVDYQQYVTRPYNVFAWLPTLVGDNIVWLSSYQILQVYHIFEYPAIVEGKQVSLKVGKWVNTYKRLITK